MTVKELTPLMEKFMEALWELPGDIDILNIGANFCWGKPCIDIQASEHIDTHRLARFYGVPVTEEVKDPDEDGQQWTWDKAEAENGLVKIVSYSFKNIAAPGVTSTEGGTAERSSTKDNTIIPAGKEEVKL